MVTLSKSEVVGCGWSEVNSGGESQDFTTMARMVESALGVSRYS